MVVLHGDEGTPDKVFSIWKKPAEDAGVVLLAPKCPRNEGCQGSWWRWRGDPEWVLRQADAVAGATAIDPARRYLAGWSGGATYITLFAPRWSPPFTALSLAGGGASPDHPSDCPPCRAAVHYLQGDKNPLFWLAENAHHYLVGCGYPVEWDVLTGANHAREFSTYSDPARIRAILGWMQEHAASCSAVAPASASAAPSAAVPTSPASAAPTPPPASPPQRLAPSHCACATVGEERGVDLALLVSALANAIALCVVRRARRIRQRPSAQRSA